MAACTKSYYCSLMPISNNSTDVELVAVIEKARGGLSVSEIADLTHTLAISGETLPIRDRAADVPSTGGPSSLSTLLCPPLLSASGWIVPKLGVPGRPAGGIDVLAQIPGYKISLGASEIQSILFSTGYAHFIANSNIAPLDARLFSLRQHLKAQAVPGLVIASLLSKKLAVGVKYVGLDVRVAPHGNFGRNMEEATKNAEQFCEVASQLGITATCFLTDASVPYQPYIGKKEALLAISHILTGQDNPWLNRHYAQCERMARETVQSTFSPSRVQMKEAFIANITAQNGSEAGFWELSEQAAIDHRYAIEATSDGYPSYDLDGIRSVLVAQQKATTPPDQFADPIGIILKVDTQEPVVKGSVLATVRGARVTGDILAQLTSCINVTHNKSALHGEKIVG